MGSPSPRPGRVTEVTYSTFRAQPPGEYSHRPAGTQTPLDWHPRSFSWHPNRYEAGTQSLFESDQPNERTRNALMLFRVALYDCLWRRSNSERDPPTRPLSRSGFLLFVLFVLWYVRVRGTSREAASPPLRRPHCTDIKNLQLPTKIMGANRRLLFHRVR